MAFESPIYKAPAIPKISSRNISSSVIRGAQAASTAATPRLRRSSFSFLQRPKLQGTQGSLKLETNQVDALQETNRILVEIQNQLAIDFSTRIAERKQAIRGIKKQTEKERASRKEASIESIGKFNQKVGNFFDKVTAPAKNIFQKLIDFFGIIVSGIAINTAFTWLSDKNNQKKLSDTLSFVGKYWKEIVGTLIGLQLISTIASLVSAFQVAAALLTSPAFLTAVGGVIIAASVVKLGQESAQYFQNLIKQKEKEKGRPLTRQEQEEVVRGQVMQTPGMPFMGALVQQQLNQPPIQKRSHGGTIIPFNFKSNIINQYPNIIQKFSTGGTVGGKGSGKVDSVPARLAPGEEVIKSSMAMLFRPLLKDINDAGGRLWYTFSNGVREMLDGNKMLKVVIYGLQYQLNKFTESLDKFTNEIKLGKIKNKQNPGNGPVVPKAFPMIPDREEVIQPSSVKQLRPIIKAINVERTKKSKRSSKEPIIIPMSKPPIVQGGGDELVQPSGGTATEEPSVGSVNMMNPYMRITSKIYGIFV